MKVHRILEVFKALINIKPYTTILKHNFIMKCIHQLKKQQQRIDLNFIIDFDYHSRVITPNKVAQSLFTHSRVDMALVCSSRAFNSAALASTSISSMRAVIADLAS